MCPLSHTFNIVWSWKNIRFLVTLLVSLTWTIAFPSFFCYSRSTLTAWFNLETCSRYKYTNLIAIVCHNKGNYSKHISVISPQISVTSRETNPTYISYLTTSLCHIKVNYTSRETTLTYISYLTTTFCHIKGNYSNMYKLSHHNFLSQQGKLL